jgi:hypothetical protein
MRRIVDQGRAWLRRSAGQAMPEYAVALALVTSTSAFLFAELGTRITGLVTEAAGLLP